MRRLAALAFCLVLAPCASADTITVFAAASLKEALDAAAKPFEDSTGNKVAVSYAASSALARQIEAGAPATLFISADLDWVDYVEKRGLAVPGTRRNLLGNDLVLIAPAAIDRGTEDRAGLRPRRRARQGRPPGARQSRCGPRRQVREGGAHEAGCMAGSRGTRRAARRTCARPSPSSSRGEAPLGIVYRTDAMADKGVRVVDTFPAGSHPAIIYPMRAAEGRRRGDRAARGAPRRARDARRLGALRLPRDTVIACRLAKSSRSSPSA